MTSIRADTEKTMIERVNEELSEFRTFHEEQAVESRTWRIPTHVYDALRRYIVGEYGTTQHIGAFVTQAVIAWNEPDKCSQSHLTWAHLKNDYDYRETDVRVENWNYRSYIDYSDVPSDEKTALCFSAPKSVLGDFIRGLDKQDYGNELANAVSAELLKQTQIRKMQALLEKIANSEAEVTGTGGHDAPKVEVDADGTPVNLSDLRMTHTSARLHRDDRDEMMAAIEGDLDYEVRRGIIAAELRTLSGTYSKGIIYRMSEELGVTSRTSQRRDLKALRDHVRRSGDDEPLFIHPSQKVRKMKDTHNLPQESNLMASTQLAEKDEMVFNQMNAVFYNAEYLTHKEVWDLLLDELYHNAELVCGVNCNHPNAVQRVFRSVKQRDNLSALLNVVSAYKWVLDDEEDYELKQAHQNRLNAIIESIRDKMDFPEDLDDRAEHFREKNRDKSRIGRKGGKKSKRGRAEDD